MPCILCASSVSSSIFSICHSLWAAMKKKEKKIIDRCRKMLLHVNERIKLFNYGTFGWSTRRKCLEISKNAIPSKHFLFSCALLLVCRENISVNKISTVIWRISHTWRIIHSVFFFFFSCSTWSACLYSVSRFAAYLFFVSNYGNILASCHWWL